MNCSNKPAGILHALCAAAILLISANACTKVDDRLGASILPRNQKMKIVVDTLPNAGNPTLGIRTFLFRQDSVVSSRLGYAYFGKEEDAVFGKRKNSVLLQFRPSSYPTSYSKGTTYDNFGLSPIIDSAYIYLPIYDAHGDTTKVAGVGQIFDVYEVIEGPEELSRDSVYYANFPIGDYKGDKLFSFTHSGRRDVMTRMVPTNAGKDFLKRLISMDMEDYVDDSLFRVQFKGLYITPADASRQNAATYSSSLADARMIMYSRCHDTLDIKAIYDTLYSVFSFRDTDDSGSSTGYALAWNNVSINMADYDYSGSTLGPLEAATDGFTDTLESSAVQPLMYVQPMGGVTGYLRFTDGMVDYLRNLKIKDGKENDILIDQAMMYIWLEEGWKTNIPASLDNSMTRMGSYTDIRTMAPIPDYMYYYEASYKASSTNNADYVLPYNGYLNRSNGYYPLDITSFVQQLAKEKAGDPDYKYINPVINLAPDAYNFFGFGQSTVQGSGNTKPIKIRLTYTLIEKE